MNNETKTTSASTRHQEVELLSQFHHRLLALEVDLKERARQDATPRALAKRVRKLRTIQSQIRLLRQQQSPVHHDEGWSTDLGLPAVSACGPDETTVCEAYLQHREKELRLLDRMLRRLSQWVEAAATGRSGLCAAIWRLANLRRYVGDMEAKMAAIKHEKDWLEENSDQLLASLGLDNDCNSRPTLKALIAVFEQVDQAISRIAALRAKVRKVENDVQVKEAWLTEQEEVIKHYRPCFATPEPTAIWKLQYRNSKSVVTQRVRIRKDMVQRFWEDVLTSPQIVDQAVVSPSGRSLTTTEKGG